MWITNLSCACIGLLNQNILRDIVYTTLDASHINNIFPLIPAVSQINADIYKRCYR